MAASKGILIVFEGDDGVGKSTQVSALAMHLRRMHIEPVVSREPGGTGLGAQIRQMLLSMRRTHDTAPMAPLTELFLFQADHEQLLAEIVQPALANDRIVILDRYLYSSIAYQIAGRHLTMGTDVRYHAAFEQLMRPAIEPDRVFLLHSYKPVETAQTRIAKDRISAEGGVFHEIARRNYLHQAQLDPVRWRIVAADGPAELVAAPIWRDVDDLLRQRGLIVDDDPDARVQNVQMAPGGFPS